MLWRLRDRGASARADVAVTDWGTPTPKTAYCALPCLRTVEQYGSTYRYSSRSARRARGAARVKRFSITSSKALLCLPPRLLMALRSEDLKGQREALTDDVDGSGGEESAMTPEKSASNKEAKKTLRDSAMPVIMISALLLTFGALAGVVIFVVGRAFGNEEPISLFSNEAALGSSNATRQ